MKTPARNLPEQTAQYWEVIMDGNMELTYAEHVAKNTFSTNC